MTSMYQTWAITLALGSGLCLVGCAASSDDAPRTTSTGGSGQSDATGGSTTAPATGGGTAASSTGGASVAPASGGGTGGSSAASATGGSTTASAGTTAAAGTTAVAAGGAAATTGVGVLIEGVCTLLCADDSTDDDGTGTLDGWGFEQGTSCVVPGGAADTGEACDNPEIPTGSETASTPGGGVLVGGECRLVCMDDSTDADASGVTDGWGFEQGVSCIVSGSAADTGEACDYVPPEGGESTPGGTVDIGGTCYPVCMDDSTDDDGTGTLDGWGYENEESCIVPGGLADTGVACAE